MDRRDWRSVGRTSRSAPVSGSSQQATSCPSATASSAGFSRRQRSKTCGATRRERTGGGRPSKTRRLSGDALQAFGTRVPSSRGRVPSRPRGIGMPGAFVEQPGVRAFDHQAAVHHHDTVRKAGHYPEVVRDPDDRHARLAPEPFHQIQDLRLNGDVEGGGRLVRDQHLRAAGERDGDHHPLAHAARELMREVAEDGSPAAGMPTRSSSSTARRRASPRLMPRCTRNGSVSW